VKTTWIAALSVPVLLISLTAPARAQGRGETTIVKAMNLINEMDSDPETNLPPKILRGAQGIAIIPDQFKAGFVLGARYGRGLVMVRQDDGSWSNPVFITTFGGSFGLQAGAQATDLILVFRGKKSVNNFLQGKGKLTLGVDASVAAGPLGRAAEAGTDVTFRSEILSYSRNRGAFAGVSAGGGTLSIDKKTNAEYYGPGVGAENLLAADGDVKTPRTARELKRLLGSRTGAPDEADKQAKTSGSSKSKPKKKAPVSDDDDDSTITIEGALPPGTSKR
jgi:lipid-binding SYLF domain-containing protein